MNNFKRLQEEELDRVPDLGDTQRAVRDKVSNMRTVGQVFELYMTKILDLFVVMTGGNVQERSSTRKSPDKGYPTDADGDTPPGGPSAG